MSHGRHETRAPRRWTGTWRLSRLRLRTHRWALLGWPLVIGVLVGSTAYSIGELYRDPAQRVLYAETVGSSTVSIAVNGRGYDLLTVGGIVVYELGFYTLLIVPVIALHLAIRLTRGEEEPGRDELLTAGRLGRVAPLAAGTVVVSAAVLASGVLSGAAMIGAGLPTGGSIRYAATLALAMLTWAGVGLVTAQLSHSSRGAHMLGLGILLVVYLARALSDGRGSSLTWPNPTGWLAELRPFGDWQLWPMLSYAALALLLVAVAGILRARRDLGAGLVAERLGPARGGFGTRSPLQLAGRLSLPVFLAWTGGTLAWGAAVGALAPEMRRMLEANPDLGVFLGSSGGSAGMGGTGQQMLFALNALLVALLAAAFGVQVVGRLRSDELAARIGLLVSTRVGRLRWYGSVVGLLVAQVTIILVVGGAAADIGAAITTDTALRWEGLGAALAQLPAALVVIAVAVAAWSLRARFAVVGWVLVAWASVVGMLADTLRLAEWARDLSPLHHVGRVPIDPVSVPATVWLAAIAVALLVAAALRWRSRDLAAG